MNFLLKDFTAPITSNQSRHFLLDCFKFLAIVLMVIFHFNYDLNTFGWNTSNYESGFWYWLPRLIVFLFLFCSGVSIELSLSKNKKSVHDKTLKLAFYALCVSVVTYFIFPSGWIFFGTLHCLCVATFLSQYFVHRPKLQIATLALLIIVYSVLPYDLEDVLGFYNIVSMDFIPIYPWFNCFLIGMIIAPFFKKSAYPSDQFIFKVISVTSQKSLPIYLLHQVVMFGLMWLIYLL